MTPALRLSFASLARTLAATMLCFCVVEIVGCAMTTHQILPCPMTYSEQEKAILAIAPMGTDRETVLKKLTEAGIEGSSATSQHVYYCDIWDRPNKERWHMDVALMFDQSGKLYKTQFGQADTAVLPKDAARPIAETPPTASADQASLPPMTRLRKTQKSGGTALAPATSTN
jgi:hypothetical protein